MNKPVRVYLIQFPTVLTSVATPSRTVPVPYRTPRAVPQLINKDINISEITTLLKFLDIIKYWINLTDNIGRPS